MPSDMPPKRAPFTSASLVHADRARFGVPPTASRTLGASRVLRRRELRGQLQNRVASALRRQSICRVGPSTMPESAGESRTRPESPGAAQPHVAAAAKSSNDAASRKRIDACHTMVVESREELCFLPDFSRMMHWRC